MDKNFKNKFKNFFRKEAFYVVLFLCLCIIATVTTISYKISKQNQLKSQSSTSDKNFKITDDNNIKNEIPNSERVQNDKDGNEVANKSEETEVSTVNAPVAEVTFNKPVEGTVSREFSKTPIKFYETDSRVTYKTMKGIDIKASIGTEVKSAADGVVESVVNDESKIGVEEGVNVTILHSNGLRTKYCNLDKNVTVKNNDKVTQGTVIGKVGSTAALYRESAGEHLNLQVINSNGEQVDPLDYFSYK